MRIVEIKLYSFDELNENAKEKAIESIRDLYYESNDFALWAIDDCSLLEPPHNELINVLGNDYKFPLLKNTREKLYFSCERDRFIDISNAMKVTDDDDFFKWLGIKNEDFSDDEGFLMLDYKIGKDTIDFDSNNWNYEFTDFQNEILENAKQKFEDHCEDILKRIEADINYRFSDEAIMEDIRANEFDFEENGNLY